MWDTLIKVVLIIYLPCWWAVFKAIDWEADTLLHKPFLKTRIKFCKPLYIIDTFKEIQVNTAEIHFMWSVLISLMQI